MTPPTTPPTTPMTTRSAIASTGPGATTRGRRGGMLLRALLLLVAVAGALLTLSGRRGGGMRGGGGVRLQTSRVVSATSSSSPWPSSVGGLRHASAAETDADSPSSSSAALASSTSMSDPGMDFWWMAALRSNPQTSVTLRLKEEDGDGGDPLQRPRRLLAFPSETKRVWIDVGVNKKSDFLVNLDDPDGHDLFVVGYEPSAVWKPCPHPRCTVLWAAATPTYDVVEVNVQDGADLCNSLFKPNPHTSSQLWRGCVTQKKTTDGRPMTVQAPGVPLSEVVSRIPSDVMIEYVKIDAQGYDLEVMKGALAVSDRIQVVSLEAMDVRDRTKLLYEGQPTLQDIKTFLKKAGWTFVKAVGNRGALGEVNAFFVYHDKYAAKVGRLADVLMGNKEGKGERNK